LSGAIGGYFYGHEGTWGLDHDDLTTHLDTQAVAQLTYARNLYVQRRWYDLVPDFNHEIVTGVANATRVNASHNLAAGIRAVV
jgi:hypothetical protein